MTETATPTRTAKDAWQQADHDQRRQFIVDAALDLLNEEGLDAVTMRRVAGRLGVGAMTLYTYIDGQDTLRREMIRAGFDQLRSGCDAQSTLEIGEDDDTPAWHAWRGGSQSYLRFAVNNPQLYTLMFTTPIEEHEQDLLHGGFQPLLDKVKVRLESRGLTGEELERETRIEAGRFWIGLHGLASIAISNRLCVLEGDLDQLLNDLLPHISPN